MGFLQGKRALIVGLASNRSIAWGIAQAMRREGAELAFTYQNDKLEGRVAKMAAELDSEILVPCDVGSDEQIDAVFDHLDDYWDSLDIIVHSVAFAPRNELEGDFLDNVTREGFRQAHEISSYSFAALAKCIASTINATPALSLREISARSKVTFSVSEASLPISSASCFEISGTVCILSSPSMT